jgi:hypothetical protein
MYTRSAMLIGFVMAFVLSASPAFAAETDSAGSLEEGQVATGFRWCKVQQVYRPLGSSRTYAYLESCSPSNLSGWIWCNDNECEKIMIAAAASYHWFGVNFHTTSSFNYVKLWRF